MSSSHSQVLAGLIKSQKPCGKKGKSISFIISRKFLIALENIAISLSDGHYMPFLMSFLMPFDKPRFCLVSA